MRFDSKRRDCFKVADFERICKQNELNALAVTSGTAALGALAHLV